MPRYLFHILGRGLTYQDEMGRHFYYLEDVKAYAVRIARELAMDGDAYRDFSVRVMDDTGNEVFCVPVSCDAG